AMTLAHRVAVLNRGRLQQVGTPEDLYKRPANRFVGSFIGSPSMNFFETDLEDGRFSFGGVRYDASLRVSKRVPIGVRPDALYVDDGNNARICWIETLGAQFLVGLQIGDAAVNVLVHTRPASETLNVTMNPGLMHVFDSDSGKNLRTALCDLPGRREP